MTESAGLKACRDAFERLKNGKPSVEAHAKLDRSKITAGVVSFEAGYDRGYLKKSRPSHRVLLAKIEAYRSEKVTSSASSALKLARAKLKCKNLQRNLKIVEETMHKVLTQNIQLVETVLSLEKQLKLTAKVKKM